MAKKLTTISHSTLANRMKEEENFFCLADTKEWYVYVDGCYTNEGSDVIMEKLIRDKYHDVFLEIVKSEQKARIEAGNEEVEESDGVSMDATQRLVGKVLHLLRAECHMSREELDKKNGINTLINFKNGILDLRTGKMMPPVPEKRLIRQIPVDYNPDAKCPRIEKFLDQVVSPENKQLIFEIMGYCLIPDVSIQKSIMFYGPQGTGKGTALKILRALIGKKNTAAISLQDLEENEYATSDLYGKLINVFGDLEGGVMDTHNIFKMLTGKDPIRGRRIYQPAFHFENTSKLIFSANEAQLPRPKSRGPAFYSRRVMVEFPNQFRGTKEEKLGLAKSLTTPEELSGLLNLALEGLKRVMKNKGYSYNKTHEEIEKEYDSHSSSVMSFIYKHLRQSDNDKGKIVLYQMYESWCEYHNVMAVSDSQFGKAMKYAGYKDHRAKSADVEGKRPNFWDSVEIDDEVLDIWAAKLLSQKQPAKVDQEAQKTK